MIGVLFDIAVVYYAGGLEIFDDEKKDTEEAPKVTNRFGFKVYFIIKRLLFVLSELISWRRARNIMLFMGLMCHWQKTRLLKVNMHPEFLSNCQ